MRTSHSAFLPTLFFVAAILGLACDDAAGPATGSIRITVSTSGIDHDPDGYTAMAEHGSGYARAIHVPASGAVTVRGFPPGSYTVSLIGVAGNCTVAAPNLRTVSVTLNATVEAAFAIQCVATGSLRVTATTTGVDLDPNGFTVSVNRVGLDTIATVTSNGSVSIARLLPGDYLVTISGVAPNCDVVSANPRTVTVSGGSESAVSFAITCALATQLAFVNSADGNDEIYVINSNGTGATRLTTHAASDVDPAWSPDGNKIAFASTRDGNSEIYVMNANGSSPVRLTNATAIDFAPSWSPDGARIAFVSHRDGNFEIYVMATDGSSPIRLTSHGAEDLDPTWSPDGSKIAFRSDRDGNSEIYIMNADGSGVTRLTFNQLSDVSPAWSPDGARIAFSRDGDIFVMSSDGSNVRQLTTEFSHDVDPTWSPDGGMIAFTADSYYYSDIQVIKADGTGLANLTTGFVSSPAWRP